MRGDVSKLPKWAQTYIDQLERDLKTERARHQATRLLTDPEDTDTRVPRMLGGDIGLPRGESVEFLFGQAPYRSWVQARNTGGAVHILGSDSIRLTPRSSNVVEIELTRL